jgi:hypothetical protein
VKKTVFLNKFPEIVFSIRLVKVSYLYVSFKGVIFKILFGLLEFVVIFNSEFERLIQFLGKIR